MTNNVFGKNLKKIRQKKYPSQKAFSEIINIPYTTYAQYEAGKREPNFDKLVLIADALTISLDALFKGTTPPSSINYIGQSLKDNLLPDEELIDYTEDNDGFRIKTASGTLDLPQSLCEEIIANSLVKQKEYIRTQLAKELKNQR